jgi:hypothetical protein
VSDVLLKEAELARRYVNPTLPSTTVTDKTLAEARARAEAAQARLREAESADPTRAGWDQEYDAASAAVRATERRVTALESLRAAQLERSGKRDAAVKSAAGDLAAIAKGLAASRDAVAAAAGEHLRTLAALVNAAESHNALVGKSRDRLATLGLAVRDDLVDVEAGQEHPEGVLDTGVRAGGTDWIPVPAQGVVDHAVRQVFRDPLTQQGRFRWRAHETDQRADGLRLPSLADVGAVLPPWPPRVVIPERPSIRDFMAPPARGRGRRLLPGTA